MRQSNWRKHKNYRICIFSIASIIRGYSLVGKISKMGNNKVIWIPKEFHDQITDLEEKQVRIIIDDKI